MSGKTELAKSKVLKTSDGEVEIRKSEIVYDGFFKMLSYSLRHSLFKGGMSNFFTREVMVRPNAVAVLLFDPSNQCVILTKQFRVGALASESPWLEELVAGIVEDGEEAEDVARRETLEETGLKLESRLELISEYYGSPGGSSEKTSVYAAVIDSSDVEGVHGLPSENEDILVIKKPVQTLLEEVKNAKISSASLMIAGLWLQHKISDS